MNDYTLGEDTHQPARKILYLNITYGGVASLGYLA
jgi:hypothetical protein